MDVKGVQVRVANTGLDAFRFHDDAFLCANLF